MYNMLKQINYLSSFFLIPFCSVINLISNLHDFGLCVCVCVYVKPYQCCTETLSYCTLASNIKVPFFFTPVCWQFHQPHFSEAVCPGVSVSDNWNIVSSL